MYLGAAPLRFAPSKYLPTPLRLELLRGFPTICPIGSVARLAALTFSHTSPGLQTSRRSLRSWKRTPNPVDFTPVQVMCESHIIIYSQFAKVVGILINDIKLVVNMSGTFKFMSPLLT